MTTALDPERWDATEGGVQHIAHVVPVDDLVEHDVDVDGECACGPATIPVRTVSGRFGWVFQHHSLDGRELLGEGRDGQ